MFRPLVLVAAVPSLSLIEHPRILPLVLLNPLRYYSLVCVLARLYCLHPSLRPHFLNDGRVGESVEDEVEEEESAGQENVGIPEAEPRGWHSEVGSGIE